MRHVRAAVATAALLALLMLASTSPDASAKGTYGTYLLEDVYTLEMTTSNRDVSLQGKTVTSAWFNFTVLEDVVNSGADSFMFKVYNRDDPSITLQVPGTTDVDGRLFARLPFTREASPRWALSVTCTEAGDVKLGPAVIQDDPGNDWSLQVEYVYTTDGGGNGNGPDGEGGDGDGDQPLLVSLFQANLVGVALLSLLVAFLALRAFLRGEGGLRWPYLGSLLLLVDCFFALPVALLVNLELNDATVSAPPYGPAWLGNLAIVLLVLWAVPFALSRKRVLTSRDLFNLSTRVMDERVAKRLRRRGDARPEDPLSDRGMSLMLLVIGLASIVVAAMMLLA